MSRVFARTTTKPWHEGLESAMIALMLVLTLML
jgi:hypothetical protein